MTDKTITEQAKEMLALLGETFQVYVSEKGGFDFSPFYHGFVAALFATAQDFKELEIRNRLVEEMSEILKREKGLLVTQFAHGGNSGN